MKKLTSLILAITMLLTLLTNNVSAIENEFVFGDGYSDYFWNSEMNLEYDENNSDLAQPEITPMVAAQLEIFNDSIAVIDGVMSGQCGDSAYWTFDESTGTLTIYGTGEMWDDTAYYGFESLREKVTNLIVEDGITHIGSFLFNDSSTLTVLDIPGSVKSIGSHAFDGCDSLTSLVLPEGLEIVDSGAFNSCNLSGNLIIPKSLVYIETGAFSYNMLTSVEFLCDDCDIRCHAFSNNNISNVVFPKHLTRFDGFDHNKLTELNLPESVKIFGCGAIEGMDGLTHIEFPENLTTFEYKALDGYWDYTEDLIIPSSVTEIGDQAIFCGENQKIYFEGNAPSVSEKWLHESGTEHGSFRWSDTLYYKPGTTGWIDSPNYDPSTGKWNGYTLLPWEDSNPGTAIELYPANGTVDFGYVSSNKYSVGFDEFTITFPKKLLIGSSYMNYQHYAQMNLDKGTISLYNSSGELIWKAESTRYDDPGCTSNVLVSADQSKLIIVPTNHHNLLDYETEYYIVIDPGVIQFEGGTAFEGIAKGEWRFRTLEKVLSPKKPLKIDNGLFNYCSTITGKTASYYFNYDEAWFNQDATMYNHDLAKMSIKLAMAAANTTPEYVEDLFDKLDIDENDRVISYPYPTRDTIGYAIGGKRLVDDSGNETTLIIVAIRGGGYLSEWADNFNVGLTSDHAGFMRAANTVKDAIYSYLEKIKPYSNLKVWVTGYSRAAAVTNILSERLTVEARSMYNTTGLSEKGIYSYSFETPRPTQSDVETFNNTYDNIFSIINPIDLVPKVAPATDGWKYDRYGITYYLPGNNTHSDYSKYESALIQKYTDVIKMAGVVDSEVKTYLPENISQILYQADVFEGLVDGIAKFFINPKTYVLGNQDMITGVIESAMSEPKEPNKELRYVLDTFADVLPIMSSKFGLPSKIYKIIMEIKDCLGYAHYPELCLSWLEAIDGHTVTDYCSITRYRCITCNCPVDINVYDSQGKLVAAIVNDDVQKIDGSYIGAYIDVDGQKIILLPEDEEYNVEILASDTGKMTYTVIEHNIDSGAEEKVVSYYQLDIEKGDTFIGTVENLDITESAQYPLSKDGEPIVPTVVQTGDDVKECFVNVTAEGSGTVIGGGIYVNGEFAMVTAEADEGEEFLGWFVDDVCVSSDIEYRFLVDKDVAITAKFTSSESNPTPVPNQHTHYFISWQYDEEHHWQNCYGCSAKANYAEHSFVEGICSVCGYVHEEETEIVIDIEIPSEGKTICEVLEADE